MFRKALALNYAEAEADYTVDDDDYYVGVDSTAAAVTVTIPDSVLSPAGRTLVFFDVGGDAGTNNITIEDEDSTEITVLDADGASAQVISTGSGWIVMSPVGLTGPVGPTGPTGPSG